PGIPQINLHQIVPGENFRVGSIVFEPIRVLHYRMEVLGFRTGAFTYITDANHIAPEEMEKVRGSQVVVLNALRQQAHVSHYTLSEAIEVGRESGASAVFFTHISHQLGMHKEVNASLPSGMQLAYDGLKLRF
ncbi:MAG: MBL fold metallo-hydrolase, partial [Chitinophagaceae bacterium]